MKKKFVDEYHWIDEDEMLDLVAIAQSAPGAIAVNGAIVVGYKLAGLIGAAVSIVGTILPPFLIISVISLFYTAFRDNLLVSQMLEGRQSGVGAVNAIVVYEMAGGILHERNCLSNVIMFAAFTASCIFQVNVIYIILICGALGILKISYKEGGPLHHDLFGTFSKFFTDWTLQFWWWLCSHATYPGTSCKWTPLAFYDRIYRSNHHFPDDTWTYCCQLCYLCRDPHSWDSRCSGRNSGVHFTLLPYCNPDCILLS